MENWLVDIDGTVCEDIPNEEEHRFEFAEVLDGAVEWVNSLYDAGHTVVFFTSRLECHREVTEMWLYRKGFRYNYLITGKPRGGNYHWLDNLEIKAIQFLGQYPRDSTKPSIPQHSKS